jgi:hypothetical protein
MHRGYRVAGVERVERSVTFVRLRTFVLMLGVLAAITMTAGVSAAAEGDALAWDPNWPTFRPAEYVLTGTAGAASIVAYFALAAPSQPRWTGGILFDDAARDALRLRSPAARDTARTVSGSFDRAGLHKPLLGG